MINLLSFPNTDFIDRYITQIQQNQQLNQQMARKVAQVLIRKEEFDSVDTEQSRTW